MPHLPAPCHHTLSGTSRSRLRSAFPHCSPRIYITLHSWLFCSSCKVTANYPVPGCISGPFLLSSSTSPYPCYVHSNLCHKHKYYNISIEILPMRISTQYLVAAASAAQSQSSVSPPFLVFLLVLTKQKEIEHDCTACPQIALVFL